jgi:hypothetical protein
MCEIPRALGIVSRYRFMRRGGYEDDITDSMLVGNVDVILELAAPQCQYIIHCRGFKKWPYANDILQEYTIVSPGIPRFVYSLKQGICQSASELRS